MTSTTALGNSVPASPSAVKRLSARLGGLAMDLLLLGLFLVLGVACLDILVKIIVLIVGYFQEPPPEYVQRGLVEWDVNRHRTDAINLVVSVFIAFGAGVVFWLGLKARRFFLSKVIDTSFESFVSKRYLLSQHEGSLVNLITIVSVLGVSVGVMALVVVISVMNGFDRTLVDRMMGVFAHVEVWPNYMSGDEDLKDFEVQKIIQVAETIEGEAGAAPLIQRQTFFQLDTGADQNRVGAVLRGLDVDRERQVTKLANNIIVGDGEPQLREVVLGSELARKLQATVGDNIYAFGGKLVSTGRGPTGKISKLKVVGIFKTGLHDVDDNFAYATLETVQNLFLTEGKVSSVHIAVKNPEDAAKFKDALEQKLPSGYYVRTWQEINPEFFAALWVEKVAMFIILTLIVAVAALNIIGTLIMVVTQKTREIGILKSMGATNGMIMWMFLSYGFFIGIVGTTLGTACGLWLCRFVANDIDLIFKLPPAVYGLDRLPVVIEPGVIAFLAITSLLICMSAAIIPSFRAARLNPVEALRYD